MIQKSRLFGTGCNINYRKRCAKCSINCTAVCVESVSGVPVPIVVVREQWVINVLMETRSEGIL